MASGAGTRRARDDALLGPRHAMRVSIDPTAAARTLLACRVAAARVLDRVAVAYDPYLAGRVVERITGDAETANGERATWGAIVKRTHGEGLRAARRELAAYRNGIASASGAGLRAPKLLAWQEGGDHVELWLEPVTDAHGGAWPLERFRVAAGHIALWDARTARTALPPDFDSEDAWAERHGQPHRVDEVLAELADLATTPAAPAVGSRVGDPGFERTTALVASTPERIARLATFAQTPLHHDLVRSNLFAVDESATIAIDWENVGRGPLGVDLAPLVTGSVRRGEASADDLAEIEALVLDGYTSGLRNVGVEAANEVRTAYTLAVGLRWHVVLGVIRDACLDPSRARRGSRPDEPASEALRHLFAVSRHILDVGGAGAN